MVFQNVGRWLSPAGLGGRLSVLIFHRVLPDQDPLFPNEQYASRFDQTLRWIGQWLRVLPLDEAVSRLVSGSLPERAAAITFDDGYADNATQALPILRRHGMSATFFVATSFLNGGRMWNDSIIECVRRCTEDVLDLRDAGLGLHPISTMAQRQYSVAQLLAQIKYLEPAERMEAVERVKHCAGVTLPADLMMTDAQVCQLRDAGMLIGAHTCTHPILARLSDAQARKEIVDSKAALESLLSVPVTLFAYPNGKPNQDYLSVHARMVKDGGFTAAVSTSPGVATSDSDPFQIPRYTPWEQDKTRFGIGLLSNLRSTQPAVA